MLISSLIQMMPILLAIAGGYLYAHFFTANSKDLANITTDLFVPAMIFHSISQSSLSIKAVGEVLASSSLIFILLIAAGWLWVRLIKENPRSALPALAFMNSGFLGIPLMRLWGGNEAMNIIVIFDQVQGFFMFSIGILIITGGFNKKSFISLFYSPIIWAMILGFGSTSAQSPSRSRLSTPSSSSGRRPLPSPVPPWEPPSRRPGSPSRRACSAPCSSGSWAATSSPCSPSHSSVSPA